MISDRDQLLMSLKNNNNYDFVVLDELLIKKCDIKFILFDFPLINIIVILTGKRGQYKQFEKLTFISKPLSYNILFNALNSVNDELPFTEDTTYNEFIGSSEKICNVRKEINLLASKNCPIMLVGQSGTGKEVVAKLLHDNSKYRLKNMVTINCALLNSDIADSILFGHRKGSFTGADEDTFGLFHNSNLNTLFFDEIENISINSQSKLLRVIEKGEYRRIGDSSILKSDFRLISASNKDLEELIKEKRFREDFYYRISMFQIRLPSLNEHKEDIEELVLYYYKKNGENRPFEKDFIKILKSQSWPGNVRELNNVLEKSRVYSSNNIIRLKL